MKPQIPVGRCTLQGHPRVKGVEEKVLVAIFGDHLPQSSPLEVDKSPGKIHPLPPETPPPPKRHPIWASTQGPGADESPQKLLFLI